MKFTGSSLTAFSGLFTSPGHLLQPHLGLRSTLHSYPSCRHTSSTSPAHRLLPMAGTCSLGRCQLSLSSHSRPVSLGVAKVHSLPSFSGTHLLRPGFHTFHTCHAIETSPERTPGVTMALHWPGLSVASVGPSLKPLRSGPPCCSLSLRSFLYFRQTLSDGDLHP